MSLCFLLQPHAAAFLCRQYVAALWCEMHRTVCVTVSEHFVHRLFRPSALTSTRCSSSHSLSDTHSHTHPYDPRTTELRLSSGFKSFPLAVFQGCGGEVPPGEVSPGLQREERKVRRSRGLGGGGVLHSSPPPDFMSVSINIYEAQLKAFEFRRSSAGTLTPTHTSSDTKHRSSCKSTNYIKK